MFSTMKIETSIKDIYAKIQEADAIVIGAGAGLSTAAGYEYGGKRFKKYLVILKKNMEYMICILVDFILMIP